MDRNRSSPATVRRTAHVLQPGAAALAALALMLFASGCATTSGEWEAAPNKEYRTGSNLPVRDRSAGDAKGYDPQSVQDAVRSSPPPMPTGLRGG